MDVAHALAAAGAPAGVLVVADQQRKGRGRGGHRWQSDADAGLWMTLIERPADSRVVSVLSLRLGLALAEALSALADAPVRLKWPNDVFVGAGKVAGILVEARWRESIVDWIAIGIGINRTSPHHVPGAAALRPGVTRHDLLLAVVPRLREAARREGLLTDNERSAWHARDLARGRRIRAPIAGIVDGLSPDGALLVVPAQGGTPVALRAGSMIFEEAGGAHDDDTVDDRNQETAC